MTQDEIIEMAHEAGLHIATDVKWMPIIGLEYAEKLINLAFAKEREACANAISKIQMTPTLTHGVLVKLPDVVNAIRARSKT